MDHAIRQVCTKEESESSENAKEMLSTFEYLRDSAIAFRSSYRVIFSFFAMIVLDNISLWLPCKLRLERKFIVVKVDQKNIKERIIILFISFFSISLTILLIFSAWMCFESVIPNSGFFMLISCLFTLRSSLIVLSLLKEYRIPKSFSNPSQYLNYLDRNALLIRLFLSFYEQFGNGRPREKLYLASAEFFQVFTQFYVLLTIAPSTDLTKIAAYVITISLSLMFSPIILSSQNERIWRHLFKLFLLFHRCAFLIMFCQQILDEFSADSYFETLKSHPFDLAMNFLLGYIYTVFRISQVLINSSYLLILHRLRSTSHIKVDKAITTRASANLVAKMLNIIIAILGGSFLVLGVLAIFQQNAICVQETVIWQYSILRVIFRKGIFPSPVVHLIWGEELMFRIKT